MCSGETIHNLLLQYAIITYLCHVHQWDGPCLSLTFAMCISEIIPDISITLAKSISETIHSLSFTLAMSIGETINGISLTLAMSIGETIHSLSLTLAMRIGETIHGISLTLAMSIGETIHSLSLTLAMSIGETISGRRGSHDSRSAELLRGSPSFLLAACLLPSLVWIICATASVILQSVIVRRCRGIFCWTILMSMVFSTKIFILSLFAFILQREPIDTPMARVIS